MRAKIDARGRAIHRPNDSRFTIRSCRGERSTPTRGYMIEALCHPQSLRCDPHKACVVTLTKPALRHPQSLRCVTHKACVVCEPLGRVSSPRREGCLPRSGKGASLGAGRVLPSVRGRGFPRGGEGVSPHAGKVLPSVWGSGFLPSSSRLTFVPVHSVPPLEGILPRAEKGIR